LTQQPVIIAADNSVVFYSGSLGESSFDFLA